jgi:hypothetical protein
MMKKVLFEMKENTRRTFCFINIEILATWCLEEGPSVGKLDNVFGTNLNKHFSGGNMNNFSSNTFPPIPYVLRKSVQMRSYLLKSHSGVEGVLMKSGGEIPFKANVLYTG